MNAMRRWLGSLLIRGKLMLFASLTSAAKNPDFNRDVTACTLREATHALAIRDASDVSKGVAHKMRYGTQIERMDCR